MAIAGVVIVVFPIVVFPNNLSLENIPTVIHIVTTETLGVYLPVLFYLHFLEVALRSPCNDFISYPAYPPMH